MTECIAHSPRGEHTCSVSRKARGWPGPIYEGFTGASKPGHDDLGRHKLLSCAIASANAARRRAMKPAIRMAATNNQIATAIGLST